MFVDELRDGTLVIAGKPYRSREVAIYKFTAARRSIWWHPFKFLLCTAVLLELRAGAK